MSTLRVSQVEPPSIVVNAKFYVGLVSLLLIYWIIHILVQTIVMLAVIFSLLLICVLLTTAPQDRLALAQNLTKYALRNAARFGNQCFILVKTIYR